MATYFVDYENVGSAGIEGIDTLPEGNTVHIFYSVKADTMKMDQVIQLMRVSANVEFHDVTMRGQKNALDFQLIAMLYFTKKEDDTCYIISKDQGYDAAIVFGRKIGAEQVYRRVSICSENIGDVKPQQQTRRSGKRSGDSRQNAYNNNQEQPVLLAERAQGVTTLPYQREVIRPPRHGRKEEPAKQEAAKTAETVKQEAVKAAEPAKKEEIKAAEPAKKEEAKAAEPAKKEEIKAAEPAKKEEIKTAEPAKKEEPKKAEPANREMPKSGIPSFRREVVVVKTVENAGRKEEPAKKEEIKAAEPVKKEEPKAAEPVKEEPKAAEPVKKEEPKAAEPVKKEEPKAAEPVKKEEPKTAAPVQMQEAEAPGFLKAAAQWDIFQSSFGGLFDMDIPDEYVDGDDEDEMPETAPMQVEPAEQKDEPAKDSVKGEKHSRQRSRSARRRSQRTGQKTENAPAEQKDETEGQETVKSEPAAKAEPVNSAETAKKEEAVKEQEPAGKADKKSKEKPAKKEEKNGRPDQARKAEKKTPAVTAAPKDLKEVEKKVKEVMDGAGFALEAEDHALIAEALVSSSTKNQFYQFFRKTKGEAAGREFYLKIRGQYESLKVLREA